MRTKVVNKALCLSAKECNNICVTPAIYQQKQITKKKQLQKLLNETPSSANTSAIF